LWIRLRGSRDSAMWLAYLGFALAVIGATMIFTLVKVDACVIISPAGDRERVFVALRPQRFAPLFEERFQRLVLGQNPDCLPPCCHPVPSTTGEGFLNRCDCGAARPVQPDRSRVVGSAVGALIIALVLAGCGRPSREQARQLVERYNKAVSEAYRRADVKLIDPVVGPAEGSKLTGLIGVRLDMGLTLDSQLLFLEVTGVEPKKGELRVQTRERWRYCDRKIGTGERVGEESLDSYEMLYIFKRLNKEWVVDEIRFATPPQVGRRATTWAVAHSAGKAP
jgi:hypothetical protein